MKWNGDLDKVKYINKRQQVEILRCASIVVWYTVSEWSRSGSQMQHISKHFWFLGQLQFKSPLMSDF